MLLTAAAGEIVCTRGIEVKVGIDGVFDLGVLVVDDDQGGGGVGGLVGSARQLRLVLLLPAVVGASC